MSVKDIISITDENSVINVWQAGELIATADGKDTIPEDCQTMTVKSISAGHFLITIEV